MKVLALFDFDGTLTTKDTLMVFLRDYAGAVRFYSGMLRLSPVLFAYKLKLMKNWVAKEKVLQHFLKGSLCSEFTSAGRAFALNKVPDLLRPEARERLTWHLDQGHEVVVVSASANAWIRPWTDSQGIQLISTELECKDKRITGRLKGRNCYGPEKEVRIKASLDLTVYEKIFAYGDSRGDKEMLALATDPFYRRFS